MILDAVVRFPISMLPYAISNVAEARIGLERIQQFLLLNELKRHKNEDGIELKPGHVTKLPAGSIVMRNAEYRWNEEDEKPILHDINLNVKPGELIAIVGAVGSGKVGNRINANLYLKRCTVSILVYKML
jgi:ABC-type bacteriocin/lantibiotic exporter with double-glycine peptidase domain